MTTTKPINSAVQSICRRISSNERREELELETVVAQIEAADLDFLLALQGGALQSVLLQEVSSHDRVQIIFALAGVFHALAATEIHVGEVVWMLAHR